MCQYFQKHPVLPRQPLVTSETDNCYSAAFQIPNIAGKLAAHPPPMLPLLLLLLLTLWQAEAAGTSFKLKFSNKAFTDTPLETAPWDSTTQCAARCYRNEDCVSFQTGPEKACLLLSEVPDQDQLTYAAGANIFSIHCTRVGDACYFVRPQKSGTTWGVDNMFCRSKFGGTLPTFATEEQFDFLANVGSNIWLSFFYTWDGGRFIMSSILGHSLSTLWEQKWNSGEPDEDDKSRVYMDSGNLTATNSYTFALSHSLVVCMIPAE